MREVTIAAELPRPVLWTFAIVVPSAAKGSTVAPSCARAKSDHETNSGGRRKSHLARLRVKVVGADDRDVEVGMSVIRRDGVGE